MIYQKSKRLLQNTLLVIASLVMGMLTVEFFLRVISFEPKFLWMEQSWFRLGKQSAAKCYILDPDFGFRPQLSNNLYNEFGTRVNSYGIHKRRGITRLLFAGDSVTARGKIIDALKALYGEERFEYWNAGVESFNLIQEVRFYNKYNKYIKPDHVILFFHNNDFETTPVAFLNSDNNMVVYCPNRPTITLSRLLFKHSVLYRALVSSHLKLVYKMNNNGKINEEVKSEVSENIKILQHTLARQNIKFTVVVLPIIDSYDKWTEKEKESRSEILNILHNLRIKYIDLTQVLFQLNSKAIDIVKLSTNGERGHPGDKLALYFAGFLYEKKILE